MIPNSMLELYKHTRLRNISTQFELPQIQTCKYFIYRNDLWQRRMLKAEAQFMALSTRVKRFEFNILFGQHHFRLMIWKI